jgi:8-amino-7-oxononanoate synthase
MSLIERRLAAQQAPWRDNDTLGTTIQIDGEPLTGVVNGHTVVLAGTNNYLGLTFHPDCIRAANEAAIHYGTGTTGSRVANGTYPAHAQLEEELRDFYGARSAMVFTTGYQANLGIISGIADRDSVILLDAESHASIYDGATLSGAQTYRFKHNDPANLDKKLGRLGERANDALVITEGIYSMLGDTAPLKEICEVCKAHDAGLILDEAHSFGVLGATGRGLAEREGVEDMIDIIVGTFSKSLGCVGGYAVSRKHDLDSLRVVARSYVFSASATPSVVASARAALAVMRANPGLKEQLFDNAKRVYEAFNQLGFVVGPEISPVVGVVIKEAETTLEAWRFLLDRGVYVNLVAPPGSPGNYCLLRCSLSAAHSTEQIGTIIEGFQALAESGILADDMR